MNARRILVTACVAIVISLQAVAGAEDPPLRIGVITTYSGSFTAGTTLDAAFATFQHEHGTTVAGRKIEFIRRDDTGIAPEVARRLAQELITQEHVDFLAGFGFTPNVMAVGPLTTQAKVPAFIANAATSNIISDFPYMARFAFTNPQIVDGLARWAARNGIKTAVALYQDYGPGIDAGTTFSRTFQAEGGKMVGDIRVPVDTVDYSAYVLRIRDAHPDAVFAMVNGNGGHPFMKAFYDAGLARAGIKVLVSQDVVIEENLQSIGDQAIGIISAGTYAATHNSALNRQFVRDYKAVNPKSDPDFFAVGAYDSLAAIYRLVAAQNGHPTPDRTMELVKTLKFESPRGPVEMDPATRDLIENVYIRRTVKRNGHLEIVEFETIPMVKDPLEH